MQQLRENHETIQQRTSHLQQMQEQMNSMNDSGDYQDVESNSSGRLSHVSSQFAMIPSSRAMLSRDKRVPLDTWNQSGLQENVLVVNFLFLVRPEILLKEFIMMSNTQHHERDRISSTSNGDRDLFNKR